MEEEYKGYKIKIEQDSDVPNPRTEFDHLGTMVCFHRSYNLGDEHNYQPKTAKKDVLREHPGAIMLPLHLYDHSGLRMSTHPFYCPWDSGCIGFIYMPKAVAVANFGKKLLSSGVMQKAVECLLAEVKEYDQYLSGDVYGYAITAPNGKELDSCWGFYGYEYCLEQAKELVDYYVKEAEEAAEFLQEHIVLVTIGG